MKEIKDDTNKWRNIPRSWIGRINILKNEYTTQSNLQIQCNPYQVPTVFFTELDQIISQFVWKHTHTHTHTKKKNLKQIKQS